MQITKISLHARSIPLVAPFVISLGPLTHAHNVLVRAETDTGHVGWGEASPFPTIHGETQAGILAVGNWLAELLIGVDPQDPAAFTDRMDRAITGNACCKSAFDLAFYDLAAQAHGQPLYAYLGGRNDKTLFTDYTVSLGPVAEMVAQARWIAEQGFPVIKVKLGAGPADDERVRSIRAAVGPAIPLRLDANQGWDADLAIRLLRGWAELNVQHCEAPIPRRDFLELPRIRAASPIPLMADETCWDHHDARRLLDLEAVDRINLKLSKSGGIYKALKMLRLAEERGVPVQIGGFLESRLGFTAAAHLALSSAAVEFCDFDTPLMLAQDLVAGGITYHPGGRVSVPESIGLGARPDDVFSIARF